MKDIVIIKTLYTLGAIIGFLLSSVLMILCFFAWDNSNWTFTLFHVLPGMVLAVAVALELYCAGKAYVYSRHIRALQSDCPEQEKEIAISFFARQGLLDAKEWTGEKSLPD